MLLVRRGAGSGRDILAVVRLRGAGLVDLTDHPAARLDGVEWSAVLTTEDPPFATDPAPVELATGGPRLRFARAGAVVLAAGSVRS